MSRKRPLDVPTIYSSGKEGENESATTSSSRRVSVSPPPLHLTLAMTSAALASSSSSNHQGEDGDDSEIEFLFSLRPSPPKKVRQQERTYDNHTSVALSETNFPEHPAPSRTQDDGNSDSSNDVSQEENSIAMCHPSLTYWRQSAYLQALSEISHSILWDARWRVLGTKRQALVSWEQGDDLSVVVTLSRRFLISKVNRVPKECCCQMPYCSLRQQRQKSDDVPKDSPSSSETIDVEKGEEEEAHHDRSLNLYARLYFRKGPFFRVDDLYSKYYLPKQKPQSPSPDNALDDDPKRLATKNADDKRNSFFRPKKKGELKASTSGSQLVDSDHIQKQMEAVKTLLDDLRSLHNKGFLRTFDSEEECGIIIGHRTHNKFGLLKQDEQRNIMHLLGCKKQQRQQNAKTNNDNEILKQMCQQSSISSLTSGRNYVASRSIVLPVRKHVHQTILDSWAGTIVLKASKVDYMPTAALRSLTEKVKTELLKLVGCETSFPVCVRLREAPLKTLRRCCRLYLCATSGPGSMRAEGGTAWRSLPVEDSSKQNELSKLPLAHIIPPPGFQSWHNISYPGKDYRFGLINCNFMRAHQALFLSSLSRDTEEITYYDSSMVQVFSSVQAFSIWEKTVELRANVDYLMELREMLNYENNKRRRSRRGEDDDDDNQEDLSNHEISGTRKGTKVDFLQLLTAQGRKQIVEAFVSGSSSDPCKLDSTKILEQVEQDVSKLEAGLDKENRSDMQMECEKVLGVIALLSLHILASSCASINHEKIQAVSKRPWLRHLHWEGCLAYILWDTREILEKRQRKGHLELATKALEVLLFGKTSPLSPIVPKLLSMCQKEISLADFLLSRRARGKAFVRLLIDYVHILRLKRQNAKGKQKVKEPKIEEIVAPLSRSLLEAFVPTGQVNFATARTLARRLNQPLSVILDDIKSFEASELGHRYSNSEDSAAEGGKQDAKYSDWTPITDHTIANAMTGDDQPIGKRCSYIGFEDNENVARYRGSLNVEELAMEYYRTGRLPRTSEASTVKGGWHGWHDEGNKIRQLWRILSSTSVLDMDFGCGDGSGLQSLEAATIYLTPFQSAPFDLHCGAEMDYAMVPRRGFYERRRGSIETFLQHLSSLQPIELADFIHTSVKARFKYAEEIGKTDPALERDVQQLRSLSLLAAGLGGKMLAAIFRCLFFDYRHYSAGMPDLLLIRAVSDGSLVDLGEWIGEGFLAENRREGNIFEDRDGEFLGCNKIGDSGGRRNNRPRSGRHQQKSIEKKGEASTIVIEKPKLPDRLQLSYNGKDVQVECMFVEVKSSNDRLDARQEDWLNVLDQYGNARVCKFDSEKKSRKRS